ncbi:putative mitochondrial protein [Senna tora]|uniref:Putative mitochondrial protein n=1 Tax=Senna tora TaxID=362788 RepID=A0A834TNX6_9FABA|nr:putative mitochondrial protein [Senna tora]
MAKVSMLAMLNFKLPFELDIDAFGTWIRVVLMQNKRPTTYFSQVLSNRAHQCSRIDKNALNFLLNQRLIDLDQQKWASKLMGYKLVIQYKPTVENKAVNALSKKDEVLKADWEKENRQYLFLFTFVLGLLALGGGKRRSSCLVQIASRINQQARQRRFSTSYHFANRTRLFSVSYQDLYNSCSLRILTCSHMLVNSSSTRSLSTQRQDKWGLEDENHSCRWIRGLGVVVWPSHSSASGMYACMVSTVQWKILNIFLGFWWLYCHSKK